MDNQVIMDNWFGCEDNIMEAQQPLLDLSEYPFWNWQCEQFGENEIVQPCSSLDITFSLDCFHDEDHQLFNDDLPSLFVDDQVMLLDEIMKKDCDVERRELPKEKEMVEKCSDNDITFEDVSRYFYMPITQAAKELNVGLTLLKKKCRQLGIPRWPHRKMKSLQTLINNVQELMSEGGEGQLRCAVEMLEQEKKLMERDPGVQLEEKTKRLRQACFKASYKKRRCMELTHPMHAA